MVAAYINRISTAVPPFDVHQRFIDYASGLLPDERARRLFRRMADRAQIAHRYSFLRPGTTDGQLDALDFYPRARFPDTRTRMRFFEDHAFGLAAEALEDLRLRTFRDEVTHLIVVSCTGLYAPGLDIEIVNRFGLEPSVERTVIGFMGCYAAVNALKLARHIVHSEPCAKVVVVNLELCTLHLQETNELDQILCFLLWADGCSATLVSAEASGIELRSFHSTVIPDSLDQMSWRIGDGGFDMVLSGSVPLTLSRELPRNLSAILGGRDREEIAFWAVHPGGRSILDAIAEAIHLDDRALHYSRNVLHRFGNMSSATIMFVLKAMLDTGPREGFGCGMAFGPGLTAESMIFAMTG